MHTRAAVVVILAALALAPQARGDTVYGPNQHPLVLRSWCVHLTGAALVTHDSTGKRVFSPVVGIGGSFLRWGALRLPVLQVQLGEADQSVERLLNKSALLGSAGIALRTGDWDNGRFEPQFHAAYTYDITSKRHGFTIGMGIGF